MCVGIELCSKKNCLEQERCVTSLTFKIEGPEVLGRIELNQFPCKRHRKHCLSDKACEILGQCMYEHPSVTASKAFKKELNKCRNINEISNIFIKRLSKVKRKK